MEKKITLEDLDVWLNCRAVAEGLESVIWERMKQFGMPTVDEKGAEDAYRKVVMELLVGFIDNTIVKEDHGTVLDFCINDMKLMLGLKGDEK